MQVGELYYRSQRRQYYGNLGATDYASCLPEVNSRPLDYVFRGAPMEVSFTAIKAVGAPLEDDLRPALVAAGHKDVVVTDNSGWVQNGPVVVTFTAAGDRGSVQDVVGEILDMARNAGYLSIASASGKTDRPSPDKICAVWKGGPPLGIKSEIDVPAALDKAKKAINEIGWPVYVGIALLIFMFKS